MNQVVSIAVKFGQIQLSIVHQVRVNDILEIDDDGCTLNGTLTWNINEARPTATEGVCYWNTTAGYDTIQCYDSDSWFENLKTEGGNMTGEINMTSQNITTVDCITFASGGKICSGT